MNFELVLRLAARSDRASRCAACVVRILAHMMLCAIRGSEDTSADIGPGAAVEWLFLLTDRR